MLYMMLIKYRGQQYAVRHDEDGFYTVQGTNGDHFTEATIAFALEEITYTLFPDLKEDIIVRPVG